MQKYGATAAGKQRWRCTQCNETSVRKRPDRSLQIQRRLFKNFLISKTTITAFAQEHNISRSTQFRHFLTHWKTPPPPVVPPHVRVLVIDATSITTRQCMLFIAADADTSKPVFWSSALRESGVSWYNFLLHLHKQGVRPAYVVCDGQRGLLQAIRTVFPDALVQRCLIHVVRQTCAWLTRYPKTAAGRELLVLAKQLSLIRTRRHKRKWIKLFHWWCKKHHQFLCEKSVSPTGKKWYTHRRLRGTKSLIKNAIPDLFRFVTDPTVPRTSNHVEGGINARIQELIRCHRGITTKQKLTLASYYLSARQEQKLMRKPKTKTPKKPTRNDT